MHRDTELFKGKRFVVTAGPTREYLDPIRFITNESSGKMGVEIAKEAKRMGGHVHLICGPSSVDAIGFDKIDKITTTEELFKKTKKAMEKGDILIMAAAPADFKPEVVQQGKIQKTSQLNVQFFKTTDVIKEIGKHKNNKIIVGFALQTEDIEKNAVKKMRDKKMDIVVANSNLNMGQDYGSVIIIDKTGRKKVIRNKAKQEIAREILIFLKSFIEKERRNG
jgi:phosphopantothenoylcysteine decarboxylase/phosphopantothenate--cysteine ligase